MARLADGYRQNGNWDWLTRDNGAWFTLVREEIGGGVLPPRSDDDLRHRVEERDRNRRGRGTDLPLVIDPRLMLLDAAGNVIVGLREGAEQAERKPVQVDGRVVGFLAYVPRLQMVTSLERVFSAQQNRRFGAIAIGLLAAVLRQCRADLAMARAPASRGVARCDRARARRVRHAHHGTRAMTSSNGSRATSIASLPRSKQLSRRAASGSPTLLTSCARHSRRCAPRSKRWKMACAR